MLSLENNAQSLASIADQCRNALGTLSYSGQIGRSLELSSIAHFEGVNEITQQLAIADAHDTGVMKLFLSRSMPPMESAATMQESLTKDHLFEGVQLASSFSDSLANCISQISQRTKLPFSGQSNTMLPVNSRTLQNQPQASARAEFGKAMGENLATVLKDGSRAGSVLPSLYRLAESNPLLHHTLMSMVWSYGLFPGLLARGSSSGSTAPVALKKATPPPVKEKKPTIISIDILDSDKNDQFVTGTGVQFVNLKKEAKWIDGTIVMQKDRCSQKLRFKVSFDKPGGHGFKVKMKTKGSNVTYTATEKARNSNFKYQTLEKSYNCKGDGTKIVDKDFFVTPAGGDVFWLEATDDQGKKVKSAKVETTRLVYGVELKMKGLKTVATSTATVVSEFDKHGIQLEMLASTEMAHIPNISTTDTATFKKEAKKAYNKSDAKKKEPNAVAIGYTDHLAVKDAAQIVRKSGVDVGKGKSKVKLPIKNSSAKTKYLWKDLVPKEDWFVSATFLKNGATVGKDEIAIPEADCKAIARSASVKSACNKVEIDVSKLPAGTGTITLKVDWVNRMRAGLSFGGGNLICVCTRAWWRDISTSDQNDVIVHEMGHKIGMVPTGSGKGPDKTATQYTGKGHVGSHCYTGAGVLASYSGASGTCVMFGSTNGSSAFCGTCKPAAKKVDISSGWAAF